ncbi:MAG: radical SAM protein [Oscillospiraceae bacterium]|nr:radical SAM protein [Oscillospiraceae bacterium]
MHNIRAKTLLSAQNGMNLYRGCTHGCIYCDSRSECYGFDHAFEDIAVKENAPQLLTQALRSKRKRCMIGTGSMCDPYMPLERELCLTRRCLEIIDSEGFGAALITKSDLVLRDIDLLQSIHRKAKAVVQMTLTTYDEGLCRIIEPGVCTTKRRYEALCALRDAGIPTVVWLSPILPYINDTKENLAGILRYCIRAGVKGVLCFGMGVTLREGNREYFYAALDRSFPGLRERYEQDYGLAYELTSLNHGELMRLFHAVCEKYGMMHDPAEIFAYLRELPEPYEQLTLF